MGKTSQIENETNKIENKSVSIDQVQEKIAEMLAVAKEEAKKIIEDAKSEVSDTILESKSQTQEQKAVQENEARLKELVTVKLFKDNKNYKDDVFVAVNGKAFQIKRGVEVQVPRYVKMVLDNSIKQDESTAAFIESKEREYENNSKVYQ